MYDQDFSDDNSIDDEEFYFDDDFAKYKSPKVSERDESNQSII